MADPEVAGYARQVREALADVPAARVAELLEDLEEHLLEVAAETPEPLVDRLGSPQDYAAELRRAAGLAEAPAATGNWSAGLRQHWSRVEASTGWAQLVSFLPELRPAWWVVRGWAAVAVVQMAFVGRASLPLPTLGLGVFGLAVLAAAVVWSVRLGLRSRAAARPLGRPAAAANLVLAVCALTALVALLDGPTDADVQTVYYDDGPPTLTHEDGTPITNIVPFTPDGQPLTGVLLYDQDGRPIDNLSEFTTDGEPVRTVDQQPPAPANAFPRQQTVVTDDGYGNEVTRSVPPAAPSSTLPDPLGTVAPPS